MKFRTVVRNATVVLALALFYGRRDLVPELFGVAGLSFSQLLEWQVRFYVLFLLSLVSLTIISRVGTGSERPEEEHLAVSTLNRVLKNTVEQGAIFGLLLANCKDQGLARELICVNALGRVTFAAGYLLGVAAVVPELRSFGFSLNICSVASLIWSIFVS